MDELSKEDEDALRCAYHEGVGLVMRNFIMNLSVDEESAAVNKARSGIRLLKLASAHMRTIMTETNGKEKSSE